MAFLLKTGIEKVCDFIFLVFRWIPFQCLSDFVLKVLTMIAIKSGHKREARGGVKKSRETDDVIYGRTLCDFQPKLV